MCVCWGGGGEGPLPHPHLGGLHPCPVRLYKQPSPPPTHPPSPPYPPTHPSQVYSVDCNPAQSALLELKQVAVRQLPYDDFWMLFGEGKVRV